MLFDNPDVLHLSSDLSVDGFLVGHDAVLNLLPAALNRVAPAHNEREELVQRNIQFLSSTIKSQFNLIASFRS